MDKKQSAAKKVRIPEAPMTVDDLVALDNTPDGVANSYTRWL